MDGGRWVAEHCNAAAVKPQDRHQSRSSQGRCCSVAGRLVQLV